MEIQKKPKPRHVLWLLIAAVTFSLVSYAGFGRASSVLLPIGLVAMILSWLSPKTVPTWVLIGGFVAALTGANALASIPVGSIGRAETSAELPRLEEVCHAPTPTIVVFGAQWCPACRELENGTLKDAEVVERLKGHEVELVDVEKNPSLARQAQVRALPTVYYVSRTCASKDIFVGYKSPKTFIEWLDNIEKH